MDVALEDLRMLILVLCVCVSILVLVDVALEVFDVECDSDLARCFNPCSRGCCARSMKEIVFIGERF